MRSASLVSLALLLGAAPPDSGADLRFEKVSDHCHVLRLPAQERNVCAVGGGNGMLLVNPPPEPDLASVLQALGKVSRAPVMWIVHTDLLYAREDAGYFPANRGAVFLASGEQFKRMNRKKHDSPENVLPGEIPREKGKNTALPPAFVFGRQITLYPDGVEVRVAAVDQRARSGADVFVLIPSEKVLITGELYRAGGLPEILSGELEGSVLGWIDGFKQVIDAVPLLKSAMPQPKPDPSKQPEEEKPLEELVTVIAGRGPFSNLMEMKNLQDTVQGLRTEISRAVNSGRSLSATLSWASLAPYKSLAGFENFASLAYTELQAKKGK